MESNSKNCDEGTFFMFQFTLFIISVVESGPKQNSKQSNTLPLWGNERTMNLNPLILTNIQSSHYFKGNGVTKIIIALLIKVCLQ